MLLFLLGFVLLLVLVSRAYLMPALSAAGDLGITPQERGHLAAYSTLLLVVVLLILAIGLMMTMRVRRFFVRESRPTQTQYVDAWAEAGRRAKAPEAEDPAEPSH
jgi:hypothetical protein